jgi:hypothetical protein
LRALTEAIGGVLDYGRALPEVLTAAGLTGVGSSRVSHRLRCGTPEVETLRVTFEQVRQRVVTGGLIASARLDAALDALDTAGSVATSPTMVTAWGRKAGDPGPPCGPAAGSEKRGEEFLGSAPEVGRVM